VSSNPRKESCVIGLVDDSHFDREPDMGARHLVLAVAAIGVVAAFPAVADDTGLAVMHDLRREGGRTCFLDHYHYGNSSGMASRKAAETDAINSWASFVDFEYGSDWARYSRAASKSVKCDGSSGGWGCQVEARPCR
jgi:hypothetical protein